MNTALAILIAVFVIVIAFAVWGSFLDTGEG